MQSNNKLWISKVTKKNKDLTLCLEIGSGCGVSVIGKEKQSKHYVLLICVNICCHREVNIIEIICFGE